MRHLIVGMGEIGTAYHRILSQGDNEVLTYDKRDGDFSPGRFCPKGVDVLHICTPFINGFVEIMSGMAYMTQAKLINVQTTVPPGTTSRLGPTACHSTTRIMHSPARIETAVEFIRTIPKHIGGRMAAELAKVFEAVGVECICEARPEVTELAHILNNIEYGLLSAFTDEKWRICRMYGVDPLRAVHAYTQSYNAGYGAMGHESKNRPLLTPPQGHLGGHCINSNAVMMKPILKEAGLSAPLLNHVADFNAK